MTDTERVQRFGAALTGVMNELDWVRLGHTYCEGDGSEFFDDERRQTIVDTGLEIADAIASQLVSRGPQRSLYVGAAVAELAPILAESLVLGREVIWLNLPGEEQEELTRALGVVSTSLGVKLPAPSTAAIETVASASCDHLWLVSVLTDPDVFPALHDELYERRGTDLATGRGDLSDDRRRADELGSALLKCAAKTCLLSTTEEEIEVLRPLFAPARVRVRPLSPGPLSALVADRIEFLRLSRRDLR